MDTQRVDRFIRAMGWVPTDRLRDQVRAGMAAMSAEAQPVGVEGFMDWVIEQMPAGTVIDNPELWAERLARAYELNVPPPSASVGAGEVDCRCVDCGGNQPGHDPTCSYIHELHGEARPVAWLSDWKHAANGGVTRDADIAAAWEARGEVTPLYTAPQSAPVGVGAVKCPWDEGSPCVDPRPAGMVYPTKPAPRASGYLDSSGVEWNAWDAGQMEAYARAAYSDGWEAGYRAALAQQPAAQQEAQP